MVFFLTDVEKLEKTNYLVNKLDFSECKNFQWKEQVFLHAA